MKKIVLLFLGVCIIALSARITTEVPLGPGIPISGQSLAVLLVGWFLGPVQGGLALIAYIIAGGIGAPVFAEGASGWSVLQKGSGGFLLGFIPGAILSGYLSKQPGGLYPRAFNAMLFGTLVIIGCGLARLTQLYGISKALEYGFYPFWPGAVIKILLGLLIILGWHYLRPQTEA